MAGEGAVAGAVAVAEAGAVFLFCRCKSRNVTGEELGLHIQDGCYLVPLEEWQVQGKKLTAPMHPI